MTIEEIANSMTRDEFCENINKYDFGVLIVEEGKQYNCPSDLNLHDSCGATQASCKECWLRAVEDVTFKGEEKGKESVTELKKIIKFQSEYITKLERMLFNE